MQTIYNVTGTEADASITIAQIGRGNLLACGAREFVRDNPTGLLMFRVGPERAKRKVIVRLLPSDTYAVERGHIDRKTYDYVVDEQELDVYADQLGETVRRLGDV